jgi:hypothetical protein
MLAINLWSGPRNVSTALMYSFAERSDTHVVDEPLYGHFLRVTGTRHPGRDEVLQTVNCDGNEVMRTLLDNPPSSTGVLFIKQMAHHLINLDERFLDGTENIFLIRDPRQMLPSLTIQLPDARLMDTGLKMQWELFVQLRNNGQNPAIIDSRELLLNPPQILKGLCDQLGIAYSDRMLSWKAGPRDEDGIWAKHWYRAVHKSTGFAPYVDKTEFPSHLDKLLAECSPWYEKLFSHAIQSTQ